MRDQTTFISTLPQITQDMIYNDLLCETNLTTEDIDTAMNSRLSDLSDTINIQKYL